MKSFVISFTFIFISCLSFAQSRQYLLAGQSNARGRGDATLAPTVAPMTSYEYHPNLNALFQLEDPVGVNSGAFQQAVTGSAWPAFAKTYYDMTSDTTVMIPAARGGSGVHPISASSGANWSSTGLLYSLCQFKVNQAMMLTGLPLDGIVWVQGEQDAARINFGAYEQDDYRDALIALIDRFREDYGCAVPFYMVLLGANTEDPVEGYDAVRAAQTEVAAIHPHTYLIHENAVNFPALGWMLDNVHYTQDGYNEIGEEGATNVVNIERTYYSTTASTIDGQLLSTTDTICRGDSVMLSAPPMYTDYQWSNGDTGQNIFVTEGDQYTVMVTDASGCTFALRGVQVNAYPDQVRPSISRSEDNILCIGDMLTLTASPAGQDFIWSNSETTSTITVSTADDFFVQIMDTNGCLSLTSDTVSTTVILLSVPTITSSNPSSSTICEGNSVILSAPTGFDTYLWSNGETTQSITVFDSGTYSCTVGQAGCFSQPSEPSTITVIPTPPAPTIAANGATTFCEGDSVTLTASTEFDRYSWSTGDTTQSITVYDSGIYSCIFISENACAGEPALIFVTENPLPNTPNITALGDTELCEGDDLTLNAPAGFDIYEWSTGESTQSIIVNTAGTYDVTLTDTNGCQSTPSTPITTTINPLPTAPIISANSSTTFCDGDSVTLSAPTGFVNYQWSNGETTQSITVTDSNTYFCIITDANDCVSPVSNPTNTTATTAPAAPIITTSGATTFCEGQNVTLTAPSGFTDYTWSNGETTQSITVTNSGTFDVFVSNNNDCQSPLSAPVTVTSISSTIAPLIIIDGETMLCEGQSVILTAPSGLSSYLWSNGSTTQSIFVSTTGTYICTITSADGCESPPSDPIEITVNPLPNTPTITPNNSTTFCEGDSIILAAPTGFDSYLWSNSETTQSITITDSGTYDVIITDTNGCKSAPSASIATTLNVTSTPSITAQSSTTFCEGQNVILAAPMGFDNYLWSNGETTQSITVTDSGTFDVIITDANGCKSMPSAPITTTAISSVIAPIINTSGTTTLCQGENVILSAPTGFSDYLWSNGETTQDITVNTSGTFTCIITSTNGCQSAPSEPIAVVINPLPNTPTITSNNSTTFCEGDSIILAAPTGFDSYLWSNSETTQSITITDSGTYDVIITDTNGCTSAPSASIVTTLNVTSTPSITAQSSTTFCEGQSVILTAPTGFTYLWSNGETTQNIIVIDSGVFNVMTTDTNDCTSAPSAPITTTAISSVTAPIINTSGTTTLCQGENVVLTAPAGSSGYLWSNGAMAQSITVSTPGMYSCIITSADGCESPPSEPIEVMVNPLPAVPIITSNPSNTFCEGDNVILTATAGFDSYLWSNGETTQSITVSTSGTFDVIVINANGCESQLSEAITTNINAIPTPSVTAQSSTTFCEGESVTLTAPAGFTYLWSNGETTQSITVTDSDTYDVVVTDNNGCESPNSMPVTVVALSSTSPPILTASGTTSLCEGEFVTLTAPTGFTNYLWSNGADTQEITVNVSGTFTCEITSANGCPSPPSEPITVTVSPLPATPSIIANSATTFCEGESVTLTAPTGFTYLWSNGETTQNIIVTDSGTYDCIVVDANGCTSPTSAAITTSVTPIAAPTVTASGTTTFCEGESVTLIAPAGFTYLWSNDETTQNITVTDSGVYDVTVTDTNGCISPASIPVNVVSLSVDAAPQLTASGATTFCEGESVTLSAPSGSSGYLWSTGATTQDITVSASGSFTCKITNTSGCLSPISEPVVITVNPLPDTPIITASSAITFCEGESVTLSAPSGFDNYEWSTGENTQSITVSDSGDYAVFVTNVNGCISPNSSPTNIIVNTLPNATEIVANGATTFCDGDSVILSAPSGFSDYEWSTGETTQSITVFNAGTYNYFVTDVNACISSNSTPLEVVVNNLPTAPEIIAGSATTFCEGESVTLSAPSGFSDYEWSTGENTQSITVYESGIYDYFLTNGNNCVSSNSDPIEIIVNPIPTTPTITTSGMTNFCDGESVTLSAPSGFDNYEWSNGATTETITVTNSGDYDVFVTNNNGCVSLHSQAINVTVNDLPGASAITTSGATTFCEGENVTLSAPAGFTNYEWSNGATTQSITVYDSGTYRYFLADANGCISTDSEPLTVAVNELPPIPQLVTNGATEFCEGESIMISAPAGFNNYLWSNGETTQEINVSAEGSYDVTITNANGCSSASDISAKIIVNPLPVEPIVQAVGAPVFCEGSSVTLVVPGGFSTYLWSTGETTQDITVSETGAFYCTVTDVNGCENVSTAFSTIENEGLPVPQITFSGETEFCEGGSVTLFAPSGYFYLWSNGETTQDITLTETSGPLSCIIMDANGCMSEWSEDTFVKVFSVPPVPTIDTVGFTTLCLGNTVGLSAPVGFDSYLWSNGETTQNISVGISGNYSVTVYNEDGCTNQSATTVNVSVNPTPLQPTITVGGSTNFCIGESVTLSAPPDAPSYLWSNGETTQSITVTETGSFSCVILDEFDCQSSPSVTVSTLVFDLPDSPAISLSDDAILCPGDTVILSAEPGFSTYLWSDGSVSEKIIATNDGEYSYIVLNDDGCQSSPSETIVIEVRPLPPIANIRSSSDFNFCEGDSITLEADAGYLSYLWSTGETDSMITVNVADEYFYVADDGFSCQDVVSVSVATGINPPPPTSTIQQIGIDTLCASRAADRYIWYRNDTLTDFTTRCIAPEMDGNWQVVSIIDACLSDFSTAYEYTGRPPTNPNAPLGMSVFPNPSNDDFITIRTINIPETAAVLDIYDVLGRLLYRRQLDIQGVSGYELTIDIERLPAAVYVAVIDAGFSGRYAQKFVVND